MRGYRNPKSSITQGKVKLCFQKNFKDSLKRLVGLKLRSVVLCNSSPISLDWLNAFSATNFLLIHLFIKNSSVHTAC